MPSPRLLFGYPPLKQVASYRDLDLFIVIDGKTNTGRYSNAVSIYYVGLIVGAPLASFVAQKWAVGKTCAVAVIFWGITCKSRSDKFTGAYSSMSHRYGDGLVFELRGSHGSTIFSGLV